MKRKRGGSAATDLRSFLQRAAAKKKPPETEVSPPTNENQMQIVVFQGQSTSGSGRNTIPLEAERDEQQQQPPANPSIIEDDESMPIDESDSGDEDDSNYNIEHDPGLRPPISSYTVNDKDSVRRSYIA